jgi:ferredoxin
MRINVDHDKCVASGSCVLACAEVFAQDDDGIVVVLDENPAPELHDKVRAAAAACPAAVIVVDDE